MPTRSYHGRRGYTLPLVTLLRIINSQSVTASTVPRLTLVSPKLCCLVLKPNLVILLDGAPESEFTQGQPSQFDECVRIPSEQVRVYACQVACVHMHAPGFGLGLSRAKVIAMCPQSLS